LGAYLYFRVLIISPKFRLKTPCGLGDPSIGSLRLFLGFLGCAESHLVDSLRGRRGPSARPPRTVSEVAADRPQGHRRPPARCLQPGRSSCLCEFLSAFLSIHFVSGFLVHEVCGQSVLECRTVRDEADSPRVHHGWSVFLGAVREVWVAISDGLCPPRGQSGPSSRTVRPDTTDCPRGAFQIA
jgi:hypothetical protein